MADLSESSFWLSGESLWLFQSGRAIEVPLSMVPLCAILIERPWQESAEIVISNIASAIQSSARYSLPAAEMALWGIALRIQVDALIIVCPGEPGNRRVLARLLAIWNALRNALTARGSDHSPQGRYVEAKLNAAASLRELQESVLYPEEFPELASFLQREISKKAAEYLFEDLKLDAEKFLDVLKMIAHDRANPFDVPNPPARVRTALAREERRHLRLRKKRELSLEEAYGLHDPRYVEGSAIAETDWNRGKQAAGLNADQVRAVEVRMEGLELQGSETADFLGWDQKRLESTRRVKGGVKVSHHGGAKGDHFFLA